MADQTNQKANQDDNAKKPSLSPWDEELPADEPKKNLVVGSLDPADSKDVNIDQDKKPVPFNIPADINEEKVGKKMPAKEIISKQPEISSSLSPGSASTTAVDQKPKPIPTPTPNSMPVHENITQPDPNQIPVEPPPVQAKPESGVSELVQPAGSVAKIEAPEAVKPEPLSPKSPPAPTPEKTKIVQRSPFGRDRIEPKQKEEPKPVLPDITSHTDRFGAEKNLDSISDTKAQPKPAEAELEKPAEKPEESNIFASNKAKIPKVKEKKKEPPPIRKPVGPYKPPFFKRMPFVVVVSILFLLTAGVYLTEMGLISVGLEKAYGIFGLESLWGGLPRNAEKSLGKSALAMKDQLNFKIKGSITLTVNKTIKSPITTPLVSIATTPYALRDQNVSYAVKGILAQYDYYNSDSTQDSSTDSTDSIDSSTSPTLDSASDTPASYGSQEDSASYQPEDSTIKQIDAEFVGESGEDAVKSEINIKKLVGSDSTLSIIGNKNDLYIKSSPDIKYAGNADSSKWLDFNIPNITENNPFKDFTFIKMDKGFSIIGRRSGNEKIGSVRCFKYSLDNLEIGDSLDYLGIKSDSVSKISGDFWIGVVDHYIYKVDLKITPSIASSISQISIVFEMYDWGVENSIIVPALSDKIAAEPGSVTAPVASSSTSQDDMYSRDKTRKSDLIAIKTALDVYKQTNGSYPKAQKMVKLNENNNLIQTSLVPEFISSIPSDPKASEGWYYGYISDGYKFTLSARLENSDDPQVTRVGEAYIHWVYNN